MAVSRALKGVRQWLRPAIRTAAFWRREYEDQVVDLLVALLIPSTSFADIGANFGLIRVRIAVRACPKSKPWCRRPKDGDTIGRPYGGSNLSCLHMPSFELANPKHAEMSVVILAWNNASDTLACLESLKRDAPGSITIVVDNGSTDDTYQEIAASRLADVLIRNKANLGFAEGNNVGLRRALELTSPLIMILNNDTVVTPGMVERLAATALENAGCAVSPLIVYNDDPDVPWFAGGILDEGWPRHLRPDELRPMPTGLRDSQILSGCCIIAHRDIWTEVGLFDTDYFLIFEDSDWSLRARSHGVTLLVAYEAVLRHKVSRSFRSGAASMLGAYYYGRNGVLFHARWQRRYLPRFLADRIIRPLGRAALARRGRKSAAFALAGVCAAFLGSRGAAGPMVASVAQWVAGT